MTKVLYVNNNNRPISGKVIVNGAKNSALPIMAACILFNQQVTLHNIPNITDTITMAELLTNLGAEVQFIYNRHNKANHTVNINCKNLHKEIVPYNLTHKMRASCLIIGPILARLKKAKIALPGGCAIGKRPIDMHLEALQKMGVHIQINNDYIEYSVNGTLQGCEINFQSVSVGATENILMAAILANGVTIINNAAIEPEISDLANFLVMAGANISGIGTKTLKIQGINQLSECHYSIIPDRLEAGTYALAAILTRGCIELVGITVNNIKCFLDHLKAIGGNIQQTHNSIIVSNMKNKINAISIDTHPYPGFPSDMQAQFASVLCHATNTSYIKENIFEDRFLYIGELIKMGANIIIQDKTAIITGVKSLNGTSVQATDLRAAAALLIAGLTAKGTTIINNANNLYRGYEAIEEKLNLCGANIKLIDQ
ncbi:UDP-N-acetylglucosamine 1-carboxyvinyltransferase [Neoehrlichia mikurensis]|uniref:UDP-N-acetylglucosamine 1-carboxyvinyltransferase n=1 Tax=Neoehrlichia mikurensis TaxID=89586 RepID=A0A9Q9F3U2_9RICK|nr:UDP-N-acetylglucosamine 1-carboxyvinyltransferase [Neoehrlichia mikurensis]QXK91705.1 UDP-N-acetylglucosamine 1-carboxyvinyltransferase [Neoehrlichia mikurensis]QXK92917.1 UDP-N-acetylglucosamine 1-carboxyvinyltransferase [Neoehrlichia mikurensis]QXK93396.1 UDP-N-acetylglucosamine 1-carboxyvinyltransferase [Neoehrlichia mikurensis]UTO55654.1 UDP-N-acetylglucosamine 1-carboxyvinyltransferase [Neoehrlichia mikurensis]UTO56575.1 UDP-N-acetylglucosamine 1-carboxyvinyltransferase [Neoehrlichia m